MVGIGAMTLLSIFHVSNGCIKQISYFYRSKKKKAEYSWSFVELKQKVPTLSKALAAMAPGSEISDM